MAVIKGIPPWYEKFGMTIYEELGVQTSQASIIPLKFKFPLPNGEYAEYIRFDSSQWTGLLSNVPSKIYSGEDRASCSYYDFNFPSLTHYMQYVYVDNQAHGLRILFEEEKGNKMEAIFLPNGNIQIHFNHQVDDNPHIDTWGYYEGENWNTILNEGHGSYTERSCVFSKENGTYVFYDGYYDSAANAFSPSSIILDTLYIKHKGAITPYNIYNTNTEFDAEKNKKFRIKTPYGIGYIYSESTSEQTKNNPIFYVNNTKYSLCKNTPNVTSGIDYEYVHWVEWEREVVDSNIYAPNSSSSYWEDDGFTIANFTTPYTDKKIYNVLIYGNMDSYENKMTQPEKTTVCAKLNTGNWFSLDYKTKGIGCDWFYSLTENPFDHYWENGYTSTLSKLGFIPTSSGASNKYAYIYPITNIYFQVQTKTVV